MKRILPSLTVLAAASLLSGCGGGGGTGGAAQNASRLGSATIRIAWPAPSRLIPTMAQSIQVVLDTVPTDPNKRKTGQPIPRPTGNPPLQVSTETFTGLTPGNWIATATAYPNADATGTPVASGSVSLVIKPGQDTPFGVTMNSTIDHIEIGGPAPNPVAVGSSFTLTAEPKDAKNNTVLVNAAANAAEVTWVSGDPAVTPPTQTGQTSPTPGKFTGSFTANSMSSGVNITATVTLPGTAQGEGPTIKSATISVPVVAPSYGVFRSVGVPGGVDDVVQDGSQQAYALINSGTETLYSVVPDDPQTNWQNVATTVTRITRDINGSVYGTDVASNQVRWFDAAPLGEGTLIGPTLDFSNTADITADLNSLYVLDSTGSPRVYRVTVIDRRDPTQFVTYTVPDTVISNPTRIVASYQGLYLSAHNGIVCRIKLGKDANGNNVASEDISFSLVPSPAGSIDDIDSDIDAAPGYLYVADATKNAIHVVDFVGRYKYSITSPVGTVNLQVGTGIAIIGKSLFVPGQSNGAWPTNLLVLQLP
jgi:hypothetical protein